MKTRCRLLSLKYYSQVQCNMPCLLTNECKDDSNSYFANVMIMLQVYTFDGQFLSIC